MSFMIYSDILEKISELILISSYRSTDDVISKLVKL